MDKTKIKRIVILRTDRIGDVVLSTPTIRAARKAFPEAYIAIIVSPETRELVAGNPDLNEIITFDKRSKHRGVFQALRFAMWLRKKRFDIALILHSTARVNLLCFLAGIPKRVGYARGKLDFLLTDRLEYVKRLGEKHESEYSLDVLRSIGIDAEMSRLSVSISRENENILRDLFLEHDIREGDRIVVLHPGASHPSKMWPEENFARLGDALIEGLKVKIILVSGSSQSAIGEKVKDLMKNDAISLCGRTSLGVLAALFKKTDLFISNDSGPVHIACAVGTPVISIFSRNEKGLSPARWRPLGDKSMFLHKDVGCAECLAHNCEKSFLCLRSITVEEVLRKSLELLER